MQGFASSRFTIVRQIGEGGMGDVFEAVDVERRARVALKTMLRQSPDAVVRFKREFRALQDLHHTNLVRLGELVSEGEHLFFTMELVHGEDFLEHVRPSVIVRGPEAREGAPAHASLVNEPTVPFRRAGESAPEPLPAACRARSPRASCGSAARSRSTSSNAERRRGP